MNAILGAALLALALGCRTSSDSSKALVHNQILTGPLTLGETIAIHVDGAGAMPAWAHTIDSEGNVHLPLVGAVHIAGLSLEEAGKRIDARYVPRENPRLSIRVSRVVDGPLLAGETIIIYFGGGGCGAPTHYNIDLEGTLSLPSVDKIHIAGLSTEEAGKRIHDAYVPRYYERLNVLVTRERTVQIP